MNKSTQNAVLNQEAPSGSTHIQRARDKLNGEDPKFDDQNKVFLIPYIRETLLTFVLQSEKFAEAVLEKDKSLTKCIASLKLAGKRASDLDVYNECVKYFIPDAIVEFEMKIKLPMEKENGAIILNLYEDSLEIVFRLFSAMRSFGEMILNSFVS